MRLKALIFSILFTFQLCSSYKIAIFTPDISGSQLIFNKKVAETLANAGHEVVMYRIRSMGYRHTNVHVDQRLVKVADIVAYSDEEFEAFNQEQGEIFFSELSFFDAKMRSAYQRFMNVFIRSCSEMLQMKSLIISIGEERFDLAFATSYDYCAIGLIHQAKIPTWIWLNSGPLMDTVAHDIGVPSPPSYVPLFWADSGDRMGFRQRFINIISRSMLPIFTSTSIAGPQTELFRKYVKSDFPDLRDIAQNCPLVMVNSHDFYDFPRPTLGKVINIGGLGMVKNEKNSTNLDAKYLKKLNEFDSAIFFSLGTVANSSMMSQEWKDTIVKTFSSFPQTLFFFRYVGDDLDDKITSNVVLGKWLPQTDLLAHPKVKIFITHGGYNSFQEAIYSAKPMISIPLFGDQKRNSKLLEKHEIGLVISKSSMTFERLSSSIRIVLTEKKFAENIKKLSEKVLHRPFSAEETLIKWTEFLAEYKDLSQMNPAGNDLNFIQYHNLDVFWTLGFIFFLICYAFYKFLGLFNWCFSTPVSPEKKND